MSDREIGTPPDLVRHNDVFAFSTVLPNLWHHTMLGVVELHKLGIDGRGTKIAICDTGYTPHPLLPEPIFAQDFTRSSSGVRDRNGHGNHCAGIALGRKGSDGRALGIAPGADLIVCKVLGDDGRGSTVGINQGVIAAARAGADVISLSLGDNGGPDIPSDIQAYNEAYDLGVRVCVAALGNSGLQGVGRPGSYRQTIGVGSLDERGKPSGFSSVGPTADVAVPGSNIISCNLNGGLTTMSGTSMACPAMAGIWSLFIQYCQEIGIPSIRGWRAFRDTLKNPKFVKDIHTPGHDNWTGYGMPIAAELVKWMLDPKGI